MERSLSFSSCADFLCISLSLLCWPLTSPELENPPLGKHTESWTWIANPELLKISSSSLKFPLKGEKEIHSLAAEIMHVHSEKEGGEEEGYS